MPCTTQAASRRAAAEGTTAVATAKSGRVRRALEVLGSSPWLFVLLPANSAATLKAKLGYLWASPLLAEPQGATTEPKPSKGGHKATWGSRFP